MNYLTLHNFVNFCADIIKHYAKNEEVTESLTFERV